LEALVEISPHKMQPSPQVYSDVIVQLMMGTIYFEDNLILHYFGVDKTLMFLIHLCRELSDGVKQFGAFLRN